MSNSTTPAQANRLLLFGPQALSNYSELLQFLRTTQSNNSRNKELQSHLEELTGCLKIYAQDLGYEEPSQALKVLDDVVKVLQSGSTYQLPETTPNAALTPLVVLHQLCQYQEFIDEETSIEDTQSSSLIGTVPDTTAIGFCTGIISTLVVALSSNTAQFQQNAGIALRLAALIGLVVDCTDSSATSITTAWTSPDQEQVLKSTLMNDPLNSYISVYYDRNRATVTASAIHCDKLEKRLREHGIITSRIGLQGRFHDQTQIKRLQTVLDLCQNLDGLRFPGSEDLVMPICSSTNGERVTETELHAFALRETLLEPCEWAKSLGRLVIDGTITSQSSIIVFGQEKCIPPSLSRTISDRTIYVKDWEMAKQQLSATRQKNSYSDDDIAVVGMACRVAGADDVNEFWDILCQGKSQHQEVPKSRFTFDTHWRDNDASRKWFGNFIRDHDAFDHKFFKKSPREVTSQDPQQRLLLQSSYQAVEMSGYFNQSSPDTKVGVYIGICAAEYEANVACYAPNAFSATGNLKAFVAGKISHYFGWTGPGLAIDTACSASAVAIHQACRAILSGECTAALAGGVNVMTSPLWYQNLAGATFLSPTGACKPFDQGADGYCRGEAIGTVFLKKMSDAVADGNTIIGCIKSTGVSQNENCTPIFVPNAPSLAPLFQKVVQKAGLKPRDITLVEAHGTGTPVGDPAEYDSIRQVFGGRKNRDVPLHLGSVKGLIGHTEAVSGVIALIKVLLVLNRGKVPPQASFSVLSRGIQSTPDDMMKINTEPVLWESKFKAAMVNNYGAAGSNASMIITGRPSTASDSVLIAKSSEPQPFWLSALDETSLREYCDKFQKYISNERGAMDNPLAIQDLAFSLSRQSNRSLPCNWIFDSSSVNDLKSKLQHVTKTDFAISKGKRPVILCFGGQVSRSVGLSKAVYEEYSLLRFHLDHCDSILQSLGYESIYPHIFSTEPIDDTLKLQTALFSTQYACAKSWLDSGISPVSLVGHSFGELGALCIAGVLSLRDILTVVASRAKLIQNLWGQDSGSMMAVQGSLSDVEELIAKANSSHSSEHLVSIACYNGPTSFTLAGSTEAIENVEAVMKDFSAVKGKTLAVTNAFHSSLVDPLCLDLAQIASGMRFHKPQIRWDRATEEFRDSSIGRHFFATHMREPVYANHVLQRLHQEFPSAIFLEAGSNSTFTVMANKALGSPKTCHFQAVNLSAPSGPQSLLNTTLNLWKENVNVQYWKHCGSDAKLYSSLLLPQYQFEKSRHWLELKVPLKGAAAVRDDHADQSPTETITLVANDDKEAHFRINCDNEEYISMVSGHVVVETAPICPATVELQLVVDALSQIRSDVVADKLRPEIRNVTNLAPLCLNSTRDVFLDLNLMSGDQSAWSWQIRSNVKGSNSVTHVKGQIHLHSAAEQATVSQFERYERLMSHEQCAKLLSHDEPDDVILGRNMYKVFAEIVNYAEPYHGLQKLIGKGNASAGLVKKAHNAKGWLDSHLLDCFSQVGGFWVNCMTERASSDIYIASGFESWMRSPHPTDSENTSLWHVMAVHHKRTENLYVTDIFIYDASTGSLHEIILGVNYSRIPKAILSKTILRLAGTDATSAAKASIPVDVQNKPEDTSLASLESTQNNTNEPSATSAESDTATTAKLASIMNTVVGILVELTGLEADTIVSDAKLADIGIDSLMGMELLHELENAFKEATFDVDRMSEATVVFDITQSVALALGLDTDAITGGPLIVEESSTGSVNAFESNDSVTSASDNSESEKDGDSSLSLPTNLVLEAFGESKLLTDKFIEDYNCSGYMNKINPKQTQLCVALILEAFEKLGCDIRAASQNTILSRIKYAPQHSRLVNYLYEVLEVDARLINIEHGNIIRTAVTAISKSSKEIVATLVADYPDHNFANRLVYFCGTRLVEVLAGDLDGVKLIFGTEEGRELVGGLYGDSLLNKLSYKQMEDFIRRLVGKLGSISKPFKVLEMGAGTGGTTQYLVPLFAELGIPVEYTFTDLAPSFVAAARKKYKQYPFMKFRTHDIEKVPADDLIGTQHLIIASNAIHATTSLPKSVRNVRKALRSDGFLMMLEMTQTIRWVDIIFGLLEGWWLFDDGRSHALSHQSHWEKELQKEGYGHVDWTDGVSPETNIQRIIIAMASGEPYERLPSKMDNC